MSASLYYSEPGVEIHCGRVEDVLATIDPRTVRLALADPPYGVNEPTDRKKRGRGKAAECHDFAPVEGDDELFDPALMLTFPRVVLWGANHYADRLPPSPSWLLWDKREGIPSNDNADGEAAWSNLGGPLRIFRHTWYGMIKASEREQRRVHPTQKPVALGAWVLQRAKVAAGDLVVVPYAGSGPDVLACRNAGVRVIAIECVEGYCAEIVKRLRQPMLPMMTPAAPEPATTGDLFASAGPT